MVYGSDWPMTDPAAEIAAIRALGLPSEDEAAILGDNLATLPGSYRDRHRPGSAPDWKRYVTRSPDPGARRG